MKFPFNENTTISRLSIPYHGDQLAARLRYSRLFGAMNLRPASIPPNSIVCIKKIRNTQPRTSRSYKTEREFSEKWKDSILNRIENLYRHAYRPISENVPVLAEAVIFSDQAELLACLTGDWCEGNLFQNWWWKSLFPNLERAQTLAKIWLESAEFIPSAVQILAKKEIAAAFVNKLETNEIFDLLEKIIQTFGLNKLNEVVFTPVIKGEISEFESIIGEKKTGKFKENILSEISESFTKILFVNDFEVTNLNFERKIFLIVSQILARAPRIARSAEFAKKIRQIKIETEFYKSKNSSNVGQISVGEKLKDGRKNKIEENLPQKIEKNSSIIFSNEETESGENLDLTEKKITKKDSNEKTRVERKSVVFLKTEDESEKRNPLKTSDQKIELKKSKIEKKPEKTELEKTAKKQQAELPIKHSVFSPEATEENEAEPFETIIRTNYGGIFFLLNFGLYLKLYKDFSEPLGDEFDLNIWDFVALSSLEFVGEKIKSDAVWNFLKHLAGRENDEEFSADFSISNEWRMPKEWLATFPKNDKWFWTKMKDRLIVRHSEKFNVLDVRSHDDNQSEAELENLKEFVSEIELTKLKSFYEEFSPSEGWLKNFYEFAERRLLQALNLENREQLNAGLFERSATVAVSATHFEATFNLTDLPLAIRFSGLDRNPGWIPAAGKYVEFYFV